MTTSQDISLQLKEIFDSPAEITPQQHIQQLLVGIANRLIYESQEFGILKNYGIDPWETPMNPLDQLKHVLLETRESLDQVINKIESVK